jgi:hypothetical protein
MHKRNPFRHYFLNVLIALDMLVNSLAGGILGSTISARAAIAANAGKSWGLAMCRFLNWMEPGHCAAALANDQPHLGGK